MVVAAVAVVSWGLGCLSIEKQRWKFLARVSFDMVIYFCDSLSFAL